MLVVLAPAPIRRAPAAFHRSADAIRRNGLPRAEVPFILDAQWTSVGGGMLFAEAISRLGLVTFSEFVDGDTMRVVAVPPDFGTDAFPAIPSAFDQDSTEVGLFVPVATGEGAMLLQGLARDSIPVHRLLVRDIIEMVGSRTDKTR